MEMEEIQMNITQTFYDKIAAQYDKLFLDWQSTTHEQAVTLDGIKMKVRNVLIKGRDFLTMLTAAALVVCLVSGCGSSAGTHADITRLDDEVYLYYMDYSKDYYGKDVMDAMRKVGFITTKRKR